MKPDVRVDILTPVYGSADKLRMLFETLTNPELDAGVSWHWWLIDDDGPQGYFKDGLYVPEMTDLYAEISKDPRCTVILSPKNRGFAGANNEAAKRGKAPLTLLLNSDIRIRDAGWLKTMADEFNDNLVGVVGAKLLYFHDDFSDTDKRPPGKVQHAGVAFNLIGQPYHVFMKWSRYHRQVNKRREMQAVTGACLMTRRKLYERVGGLDEGYGQGNFEDVQFCLQVNKELGLKVIYNPLVELDHFHSGSNNTAAVDRNQALFQMQCGKLIEYDDYRFLKV